ncbi:MAG: hypothetical protein H6748_10310 [Spirochaetaceae bacterium]|nr:hypothetical protein [Spirochaetaceae bacterium]
MERREEGVDRLGVLALDRAEQRRRLEVVDQQADQLGPRRHDVEGVAIGDALVRQERVELALDVEVEGVDAHPGRVEPATRGEDARMGLVGVLRGERVELGVALAAVAGEIRDESGMAHEVPDRLLVLAREGLDQRAECLHGVLLDLRDAHQRLRLAGDHVGRIARVGGKAGELRGPVGVQRAQVVHAHAGGEGVGRRRSGEQGQHEERRGGRQGEERDRVRPARAGQGGRGAGLRAASVLLDRRPVARLHGHDGRSPFVGSSSIGATQRACVDDAFRSVPGARSSRRSGTRVRGFSHGNVVLGGSMWRPPMYCPPGRHSSVAPPA